jgi:hypothetical protein
MHAHSSCLAVRSTRTSPAKNRDYRLVLCNFCNSGADARSIHGRKQRSGAWREQCPAGLAVFSHVAETDIPSDATDFAQPTPAWCPSPGSGSCSSFAALWSVGQPLLYQFGLHAARRAYQTAHPQPSSFRSRNLSIRLRRNEHHSPNRRVPPVTTPGPQGSVKGTSP